MYNLSLFIFRRDLRLDDNIGLIEACKNSKKVIPAFFLDERLMNPRSHKYRPNVIQFMLESLKELDQELKSKGSGLRLFYGDIFEEFRNLLKEKRVEAVYVNEDYTPFSVKRDKKFRKVCDELGVDFKSHFDLLLTRPGEVLTKDEEPYQIFTWFHKSAKLKKIKKPQKNDLKNFYKSRMKIERSPRILNNILREKNPHLFQRGGRSRALKKLGETEKLKDYKEKRNFPAENGTTQLSAHVRFGTISIREFYWEVRKNLGRNTQLLTELFWRDFFSHLVFFFPHVFVSPFNKKYESIEWENDKNKFKAWCNGETGFPIVDAGMRQMNKTGWMHNRVRMIVASFLTKDLHIDWRWGERYFASKLVDYDPASNNGGWQWAASTGADAQPYFRIFNPWRQQERFDQDALYIKKYVPELAPLAPKDIHKPIEKNLLNKIEYPSPIVDHKTESEKAKELYKV